MEKHRSPAPGERQHLSPSEHPLWQGETRDDFSQTHRSPLRFLTITIAAIFMAEVLAMIAVYFIDKPIPYYQTTLIDAVIMTMLIFPVLYSFSFRPLIRQMEKSWQAEESLLRASELQDKFFDSIGTLIAYMDRDFNFIRVNDAYAKSAGYPIEYFTGKNHFQLFPHIENQAIFQRVVETGEGFIVHEKPFEYPDQPERGVTYWNWGLQPVKGRNGRVDGLVLSLVDVTKRKHAEEALRKSYDELELRVEERTEELKIANSELEDEIGIRWRTEEALRRSELRLKRAQEISHLGSWELDLANNQLSWSDEVYRIFGLQPQEFKASYEAFLETVHPDDRQAVDDAYSSSIRDGRNGYEFEHRIIKRSTGEIRIVHEKCEHVRNEAGEIIRSMGMVNDITERKLAEEELRLARNELELRVQERTKELAQANRELLNEIHERREIERRLRVQTTAMEAAANGIVITDCRGTIQWINPALIQMSGYGAQDLIGNSTQIFRSGQHDTSYYRQMWDTILAGEVWRGEIVNRRKDGTLYVEEQTITPVQTDQGEITHFIAVKQDISERKQAEAERERQNMELQNLSNAERYQRQFSEALVSATLVLNKSLKLDEVLPLILEQIKGVIPYQVADITLLDTETFYDAAHQGDRMWPSSLDNHNRFRVESFPLFSRMRQSGEPILVPDTQKEPEWIQVEGLAWARSFLSAPLLVEKKVIGFVNLFGDQPAFFTQEMNNRLVAFAAHAAAAIQNAWLFEQVRASTERLQSLSHRLVEIQENERLFISRELHDEAGQVLTSLLVDLRLLEKNAKQSDVILKIVADMEGSLNRVIENLHRIAMALRPASLDHVGLVTALRQHVESVGEKHQLAVSFSASKAVERLPANIETVIYRVVQEALTNAVRYAHAARVDVVLTVRDGKLIVIIEDDGIGFDRETVATGDHLGLFGMRERAEMIDGKLVIESAPGKGTTIMLEVGYADTLTGRG